MERKNINIMDTSYFEYTKASAMTGKSLREIYLADQVVEQMNYPINKYLDKSYAKVSNIVGKAKITDSAILQYPVNAFEVLDMTINRPLNKFWAQKLVPIKMGGGAAESAAAFRSNYGIPEGRLAGGNTNDIPLSNISNQKLIVPVYPFKYGIVLGHLDMLKAEQINYDLLTAHEDSLRLGYWREIEYFAFTGNIGIAGITTASAGFQPGLLNIPTTGYGINYTDLAAVDWATYDVNDWINALIGMTATIKNKVRQDDSFYPDTVLISPAALTQMQKAAVVGNVDTSSGTGVATSILTYVETQIKARTSGVSLNIVELPYLQANATTEGYPVKASGVNNKDRIVMYRNSAKAFYLPLTMTLTGGVAAWSPTEDAVRKNYLAFIGTIMLLYPESIGYIDNGTGVVPSV